MSLFPGEERIDLFRKKISGDLCENRKMGGGWYNCKRIPDVEKDVLVSLALCSGQGIAYLFKMSPSVGMYGSFQ